MLQLKSQLTLPSVGLSGFETPLSMEESAVQAGLHRFAKDVLRPLGAELDRMDPADVIGTGLSREHPIEKLYRAAHAALIEDGENRVLTMRFGLLAEQLYAEGWSQN